MKEIISRLIDDFHERNLPDLIPRDKAFPEIKGKVFAVIGMRRSGKTYFCYQKMRELLAAGTPKDQILYLNFEDDRLLDFKAGDFQTILDVYFRKFPGNRDTRCYFFFDEIQRIAKWETFIRRLLDTEDVQVYLTGSSSKLLSTDLATSLRGRSLPVEIFPFSFKEFLKGHRLFNNTPEKFGSKTASILRKALADYIEKGGFPEVQDVEANLRVEVLQGYIDSLLLKDVIERHKVGNVQALKYLVRHIMNSPSGKFSINKFYNTMKGMSVKCTKNDLYGYLDFLTDAFLFYRVPIYSRSEKARMVNPTKIYTIDTGLLNAMTFRNSRDQGPMLENMAFMHLRRKGLDIQYITTKDGSEVDFFTRDNISGEKNLIQVCMDMADEKTFKRELKGLKNAMAEYSIPTGAIVTWDEETTLEDNVKVVPAWKWLLE